MNQLFKFNSIFLFILLPKFFYAQVNNLIPNLITGSATANCIPKNITTVVDNTISVNAYSFITNCQVQISTNYELGYVLAYTGYLPSGITANFDAAKGILFFTGTKSAADWQTLLRTITLSCASSGTLSSKCVSFTMGSATLNSNNGHYYQAVTGNYTWAEAKMAAQSASYYGLQGYLVTITSQNENNFIKSKISQDSWIGGSDNYLYIDSATGTNTYANQSAAEGHYYWVTGPEKGQNFSNGNVDPVTVNGMYANWSGGEPNNFGSEDFIQYYNQAGNWNDLNVGGRLGFIIEYGGTVADVQSTLSFIKTLNINSIVGTTAQTICAGGITPVLSVTATATGTLTYQWYSNVSNTNTGGTPINSATDSTFTPNVSNAGTYYYVVITSSNGCSVISNTLLSVYKKPTPQFSYDSYCLNKPINFTDQSDITNAGPVSYLWNFGDNTQSTISSPSHTFTSGKAYTVSLTITPTNCPELKSTLSAIIKIATPPAGIKYPNINAISNTNINLQARKIGYQYLWYPSSGLSIPFISNPVFNNSTPINYTVKIIDSAKCVITDSLSILIFNESDIFIPKAFTPNGDGHNDKLDIFLSGMQQFNYLKLFDRWGKLVFETKSTSILWDGTSNGVKQPSETYVWIAQTITTLGTVFNKQGQTFLIR